MSKYKLLKKSDIVLDLSFSGEYDKFKVAKNIATAVNQAKKDGFSINSFGWKSIWNNKLSKWISNHDHNWCSVLGAVLLYSDCNFPGSKIEATANVLGVETEWLLGFCNTLSRDYRSKVNSISKRKSKKGKQCRDGQEMGHLFKLAYLPNNFMQYNFSTTSKENFETHQWEQLEEVKIFLTLGMDYDSSIKKCNICSMYGGITVDKVYNNTKCYHINKEWNSDMFKIRDIIDLNCNEIVIKNILS